jgi:hypothetical protein
MAGLASQVRLAAWRRVIAEQVRGDLTQGEFCARRGLKLETLRNRKYRLARGERPPEAGRQELQVRCVPGRLVERAADGSSGVELALAGGGGVVRVARGFDAETLTRLVEALNASEERRDDLE